MSLWRKNPRRDANEPEIVASLERAGAQVSRMNAFDLLVLYRNRLFILEVKTAHGRPTAAQKAMIDMGWPLHYVQTPIDALRAIGAVSSAPEHRGPTAQINQGESR